MAPEKNREHSIKLQLPAGNVGFMRRLLSTKPVVHLLEFALSAPPSKGFIDVVPMRKLARQHSPRASHTHDIAACV
ncbi:hypothetical protein A256_21979 [Pseudomonas syringae pv. actinidiae ICMP 19103]|nr:hypothetical protein A256_21979 [Pseudomonas syringae pv. actinidiae ICMP 19103]EPN01649.1 hypothetical protein A253_21964 [Pseudomonas syringae pv. actinidiae ICMP 19102]